MRIKDPRAWWGFLTLLGLAVVSLYVALAVYYHTRPIYVDCSDPIVLGPFDTKEQAIAAWHNSRLRCR